MLITKLTTELDATLTDVLDLATAAAPIAYRQQYKLASGVGFNQADKLWHDQRTVVASATDTIDLAGALVDALGDVVVFARIKAVIVTAAPANVNNVNVVRDGTNGVPLFLALGDGIGVQPGGMFAWVAPTAAGVVVTAGTGDLLNMVNSAGGSSVTYDVIIIGASA